MATSDSVLATGEPARPPAFRRLGLLQSNAFGLLLAILAFATVFTLATTGFSSKFNIFALSRSIAINGMIGFSMMAVLVTGGLNLAAGAIGVCSAMVLGWAAQSLGLPTPLALLVGLAAGAGLGAVNGLIVVTTRLHSFVVTLATMSIFFGGMILLSQAEAFNGLPPALTAFAKIRVFGYASALLWITLGVGLLLLYLYRFTALGREMLAAGANPRAAKLAGLPVERLFVLCHTLSGALAAIAGAMITIRNGAAVPSMAGPLGADWLLPAFLAPVLGGTLLTGGAVSVVGTLLGAAFVDITTSGLYMLKLGQFWMQSFLGAILLAAVLLDRLRAGARP